MAGTVVIIVVLVLAPVAICMSLAAVAAVFGHFVKTGRDQAFEGTEQLELSQR